MNDIDEGRMDWLQRSRWLAAALLLIATPSLAQDEEEEEPNLPGLIAEYAQQGEQPVVRIDAAPPAAGTAVADERLDPSKPVTITWRGLVLIPDDAKFQLHVHGQGTVAVKLDGKQLIGTQKFQAWLASSPLPLSFGALPIEISYSAGELPAQFSLFWSSDRFSLEPIPARAFAHDRKQTLPHDFERGAVLARALRCEACHAGESAQANLPVPAPALDQLAGNLQRPWLVKWLMAKHEAPAEAKDEPRIERRMPYLAISQNEAEILADWLLSSRPAEQKPAAKPKEFKPKEPISKDSSKDKKEKSAPPSAAAGETLFLTQGCLACHQRGEFGESGLFGGGDLTNIAAKRPAEYFARWLEKPESLNRDHRMPVFELTADQRQSLALYLGKGAEGTGAGDEGREAGGKKKADEGLLVARKYRCDQCHRLPEEAEVAKVKAPAAIAQLTSATKWKQSCAAGAKASENSQPVFALAKSDAVALEKYFTLRQQSPKHPRVTTGAQLLIENNCLACHAREPAPAGVVPRRLADKLAKLAEANEELAPQIPAMTPPSLNSVGDKLTDEALARAINRAGPAHRPYLLVQMPKFRLNDEHTHQLAAHLIQEDRIPADPRTNEPEISPAQLEARALAGRRLVGTDGFGCTSCHQVGSVQPVKAPLNARGPTLSLPQNRLRKSWFDRWVRNPARIVPRMEMPSVQIPVRGVLHDKLDEQLAAVWQVLSTPGFEPPLPAPVRVARFYSSEDNTDKQPLVISDLIEHEGQTLERALLIGLPNRQNILFDLSTHRLLSWSQGDLARQRTKGKNWYWEPAGSVLLETGISKSDLLIDLGGRTYAPTTQGQWLADPRDWVLSKQSASFEYSLEYRAVGDAPADPETFTVHVKQTFEPLLNKNEYGWQRRYELSKVPELTKFRWQLLDAEKHAIQSSRDVKTSEDALSLTLGLRGKLQISASKTSKFDWLDDGTVVISPRRPDGGQLELTATYQSLLPQDEYHAPRIPPFPFEQPPVVIAPGFSGQRMALPTEIMPTALAWRPNGDLVVASLKGQVIAFKAETLSQPLPQSELLADGLAAPYGIKAGADYVDVAAKYALLRVNSATNKTTQFQALASGWGYTSDYHDWAVGLPQDGEGNYYLALPCFQDNRPAIAEKFKGSVLRLTPLRSVEDPYFHMEVLTHGHRFPMGMALNAKDELFVTDNQGNYNPFNELNFVQPGKHYGFVNKGAQKPDKLTPPAIDIPHPWTRSVNGICFLTTPKQLQAAGKKIHFGPLEGHLVGCEYDTRRLIRMSLQKVNGDYQGCSYPLTVPTTPEESPLGPICCEVSPAGELVIGNLRDSGWGAGNNIGEVIRIQIDPAKLGHGLAEMRATKTGFELDFFEPVDDKLAADVANYSLSSYRRESTPAYGGNDIDRRTEKVVTAELSPDKKRVTLTVNDLRAGHNYELRLKSLAADGSAFHPAEAHYTLRSLVK
ncbi:hypothetical protein NA78x_006029 [Anatilimnocola sp. NA78]|uniref:hypothetical protein n=1 Tax=Anatilimnocola sp. NA78 TaxID=3415683 RepID=UPI003CE58FA7